MKKTLGYQLEDVKPQVAKPAVKDENCPFTGDVAIRGKTFEGIVVSDKMNKTVKVEWESVIRDTKFNRYFKKRTRVLAHNAETVGAKTGDKVLIAETRPLSKRKHFVVIKVIKQ